MHIVYWMTGIGLVLVLPWALEDVRDKALERRTPLRTWIANACDKALAVCRRTADILIGVPLLILAACVVVALVGFIVYEAALGIWHMPVSVAIIVGAIIIAAAVAGRHRH
jgi:hypothetical protein